MIYEIRFTNLWRPIKEIRFAELESYFAKFAKKNLKTEFVY